MDDDVLESDSTDINSILSIEKKIFITEKAQLANRSTILLCTKSYDEETKQTMDIQDSLHPQR